MNCDEPVTAQLWRISNRGGVTWNRRKIELMCRNPSHNLAGTGHRARGKSIAEKWRGTECRFGSQSPPPNRANAPCFNCQSKQHKAATA